MNFWSGNNEEHIRLDCIANSDGDINTVIDCLAD